MTRKISILLTQYERRLVEDHGFPFDEIEDQLAVARDNPEPVKITAHRSCMEHLVGELSHSINHGQVPKADQFAVDEIAECLENEIRHSANRGKYFIVSD